MFALLIIVFSVLLITPNFVIFAKVDIFFKMMVHASKSVFKQKILILVHVAQDKSTKMGNVLLAKLLIVFSANLIMKIYAISAEMALPMSMVSAKHVI